MEPFYLSEPEAFRLAFTDGEPTEELKNTAILFGVEEELDRHQLCLLNPTQTPSSG